MSVAVALDDETAAVEVEMTPDEARWMAFGTCGAVVRKDWTRGREWVTMER